MCCRYSVWGETKSLSMIFFLFYFLPLSAKIFLPWFIDLALGYREEKKQHHHYRIEVFQNGLAVPTFFSLLFLWGFHPVRLLHLSSCSYSQGLQHCNLRAGKLKITESLLTPVGSPQKSRFIRSGIVNTRIQPLGTPKKWAPKHWKALIPLGSHMHNVAGPGSRNAHQRGAPGGVRNHLTT